MRLKAHYLLVVSFMLLLACQNEPECNQGEPYNIMGVSFFDKDELEEKVIKFNLVGAIGTDSVFYENITEDSLHTFKMYVNPSSDTVTFYFNTIVEKDTLSIAYNRQLEWLSEECGPKIHYGNIEMIYHTFDSAVLVKSTLDILFNENIEIYN